MCMCEDSFFTDKRYLLNTVLLEYCSSGEKKKKCTEGKVHFALENMTKENTGVKV